MSTRSGTPGGIRAAAAGRRFSARPSSAAEHSMPGRLTAQLRRLDHRTIRQLRADTGRRARMPTCTFDAPQTICSGAPPASTRQTRRRSAFGMRPRPQAHGQPPRRTRVVPPDRALDLKALHGELMHERSSVDPRGFAILGNQCSLNFTACPSVELAQEAQVVFEQQPDIVYAVLQHGQTLDAHAEGITGVLLRIDTRIVEAPSGAPCRNRAPRASRSLRLGAAAAAETHRCPLPPTAR